jgi:hypothetical protein
MKPGFFTSEFFVTIATALGSIAVAFGVVTQAESSELVSAIGAVVSAVIIFIGAVQPVIAYIKARTELKAAEVNGG